MEPTEQAPDTPPKRRRRRFKWNGEATLTLSHEHFSGGGQQVLKFYWWTRDGRSIRLWVTSFTSVAW